MSEDQRGDRRAAGQALWRVRLAGEAPLSRTETVDGDVRAATHILACVLPETWALNRGHIEVETVEDTERERQSVAALNALIGAPLKTLADRRGS